MKQGWHMLPSLPRLPFGLVWTSSEHAEAIRCVGIVTVAHLERIGTDTWGRICMMINDMIPSSSST